MKNIFVYLFLDVKRSSLKIYQRVLSIPIPANSTPSNTLTNAVVVRYVVHIKIEGYPEIKQPIVIATKPYDEIEAHILLHTYGQREGRKPLLIYI